MNILYYLSPEIELGDPLFRFGSYKSIIFPEMNALAEFDPDVTIGIIISRAVYEAAEEKDLIDAKIQYFIADQEVAVVDDVTWYQQYVKEEECNRQISNVRNLLCDFQPDLVLVYEKPSQFLRICFPEAVVLDYMFGAFSRPPYPTLASFDPLGLFGNSFLAKYQELIRSRPTGDAEHSFLRFFRRRVAEGLAEYQPFKRYLAEVSQKFTKIILVACQVDGYFAVTATSAFASQFEMVQEICEQVGTGVGVLVTQHSYKAALNSEQISYLQNRYTNFIFFENHEQIPDCSQFIIPYVDCLATVSSSLAFQAALWHVPTVALGHSHINVISSGSSVGDITEILSMPDISFAEIDSALIFILLHYNKIYRGGIFNGESHSKFLRDIHKSLTQDPTGYDYFFSTPIDIDEITRCYSDAFTKYKLKDWFSLNQKNIIPDYLLLEISKHSVVSFDLFDTLLQRPVLEPHEVFLLMEPKVQELLTNKNFPFHKLRREAEADIRRPSRGEYEITLDDIYRRIGELCHIDEVERDQLMNIEINFELSLCSKKSGVLRYFKFAKLLCLKVGVISDFYVEKEFIEKLLEKNKISPDFLYVSATEKTRKHNGTIYPVVKKNLCAQGFSTEDLLHIGDNKTADKDMAELHGIRGYHFPRAIENMKRSHIGALLEPAFKNSGLSTSLLIGLIANRFFNASWNQVDADSLFRGDPTLLGYMGYGPIILGFCQWIRRECEVNGYTDIYFLARDGHIVKQVYETLYGHSSTNVYMYSSRRAASVASFRSINDIFELAYQNFNAQPLGDYLKNRFGFDLSENHDSILRSVGFRSESIVSAAVDMRRICNLLTALSSEMLANASMERTAYINYLEDIGYCEAIAKRKPVVVDIGYAGSMQHYLMKIFPQTKVAGMYLLTHHHARNYFPDVEFSGFLANLDDHRTTFRHKFNDHVFIFESGLSSDEGSLLKFSMDRGIARPEFLEAEAEPARINILRQIHHGIDIFAKDYATQIASLGDPVALSPSIVDKILLSFSDKPTKIDSAIFYGNQVENLFGGGSVCLIEPVDFMISNTKARQQQIEHLINRSKWKAGARAYYEDVVSAQVSSSIVTSRTSINSGHPGGAVNKIATPISSDRRFRKLAKLKNNPYRFFSDSRHSALRPLRHAFSANLIGRFNRSVIRRLIT